MKEHLIITDRCLIRCVYIYIYILHIHTCGIDSTRCWKHSSEILVHIDVIASRSCCRFVGCTSMMWISRSTTSQRCSIRLRSGDCGGHLSKVNSFSWVCHVIYIYIFFLQTFFYSVWIALNDKQDTHQLFSPWESNPWPSVSVVLYCLDYRN